MEGAQPMHFKTRSLWVSPGGYATKRATDELLDKCKRAKINLILPNVFYDQTAHFKSTHYRGKVVANGDFDPLAYLLKKAHAVQIGVQAWFCVYNEGRRPSSNPDWLGLSFDGKPFEQHFVSPANPSVNPYLFAVMKDLLAYDIDGIHLDYIRYPCTAFDYSLVARTRFKAISGFDPQNFLDHVDQIIPPEQEAFPIRVLHATSHLDRIWETTAIERTLDEARIGFSFLSETPENIAALRAPGLLILSHYNQPTDVMIEAIRNYAGRGGSILWADPPTTALKDSEPLAKLIGARAGKARGAGRFVLHPAGESKMGEGLTNVFYSAGHIAWQVDGASVIANSETGEPAIILNRVGKSSVIAFGFDAMEDKAGRTAPIVNTIVTSLKAESAVAGPDLLESKRAEWIRWRDDQVTQLVREVSAAVKAKNSRLVVTSSGGPGEWEFYGCYRNARRWLMEGVNDYVFPMNYTPVPAEFDDLLRAQADAAPLGKLGLIFPGIQLYHSQTVNGKRVTQPIDAAIINQELAIVQEQGYQGFCLFAENYLTDEIVEAVRHFGAQGK